MLGRLVVLLMQVTVGWFATNSLMTQIKFAEFRLFLFAVIAAIVVYLVGVLAAQIIKDVGAPSSQTLTLALLFSLAAAALATWGPAIVPSLPLKQLPDRTLVMAGAILGYMLKK
jgi:hypothetical protein